ncbi:DUF6415 family natural product biosynthesis protein [Streptomyces lydicus]|uniref:DUF6415 family natural product biosynthesis protein n=1 Tax=Streptomyces lydicus TaxID=47763 RepID=UPI001F514CC0|nr:DUF6415 family natural product biosynthesis protein [Streptomyces lydicus]MCZ1008453.1 DUF6415 family natural product biosynthesis protein [Streptomyces lydicus]
MRLSLGLRREACDGRDHIDVEQRVRRNQAVAAAETVALVLDEDSPLPESAADVEDLARRLRGHVNRLGVLAAPSEPTLLRAQQLASASVPEGYMPSRVYLVRLAEVTRELVATVQSDGVGPALPTWRRRWRNLHINGLCGVVFVVVITYLVSGHFGVPDVTVTGAVLIALILGPMTWLVLRGGRATGPEAPAEADPTPTRIEPPAVR